MKSYNGIIGGTLFWFKFLAVLSQLSSLSRKYASSVLESVSKFVVCLQIGRMESALSALSDEQLDEISVKRSGITRRAEFLITGE